MEIFSLNIFSRNQWTQIGPICSFDYNDVELPKSLNEQLGVFLNVKQQLMLAKNIKEGTFEQKCYLSFRKFILFSLN